jgi:hypothetical protein
VLAVATFSSVRSANRSARVAERSLLAGQQPVLIPSRDDDPVERLRFGDEQLLTVPGHGAAIEVGREAIYLAIALRNGGAGLAVIHGWRVQARESGQDARPELGDFRRQQIDLYIPASETGYWLGRAAGSERADLPARRSRRPLLTGPTPSMGSIDRARGYRSEAPTPIS